MVAGGLALAAQTSRPSWAGAQTPAAAWSFTDDREIAVTLPAQPGRIVAQISAASALWDYGVRPISVFGPQVLADGSPDPRVGNVDLGAVESVGQLWGEFDLERVLALDADLVVTPMWNSPSLWYISDEGQAALAEKIPSLAIQTAKTSMRDAIERFAALAEALGADMRSPENAAAKAEFDAAVADLEQAIAAKPELRLMMVGGDADAFYVAHPDFMADLWYFRDLGMNVVANGVDDFWETLSWEEVLKYPADLILIDERSGTFGPAEFARIATWAAVPAVAAGQVDAWNAEPIYSYLGYAGELRRLAELVRAAETGLA